MTRMLSKPSAQAIRRLHRGSLRTRLLLLVVALTVPLAALTLVGAWRNIDAERQVNEAALVEQARGLAFGVDRKARSVQSQVQNLAALALEQPDGVSRLQAQIATAMGPSSGLTVSVTDAAVAPAAPGYAPAAGDAVPSGVRFTSPLDRADNTSPAMGIVMPLPVPGRPPVMLTVSVSQKVLNDLLAEHAQPAGWITGIIDQSNRVVARNAREETFVGTDIIPPLRDGLAAHAAGFVRTRNVEGIESSIAYARAPLTGFAVAIAMPSELFDRPLDSAFLNIAVGTLDVAVVGGLLSLLLVRQISRSLHRVADDLAEGREPHAGFDEITDLGTAMQAMAARNSETLADLARQEQHLHRVLDALPVGILVMNDHGVVAFCNDHARSDFGDKAVFTTTERDTRYHPDDLRVVHGMRAKWLSGESTPPADIRLLIGDTYHWRRLHGAVVPPPRDGSLWYMAVFVDIHDLHEANAALTEANAELEARVAERTREPAAAAAEMTATLGGHEQFKAALVQLQKYEALGRITAGVVNAVDSKLGVINSSYRAIGLASADATVLGGVATGSAAASHIAMLVRHLTAFARPHPFAGTFFDAKEALTDITVLCRHVIGEAYTLSLEIADDLFAVSVDRDMLQAAFIILVTSAQEAMPQGGPIAVAAHNVPNDAAPDGVAGKPGDVAISVRDLGRGMPVHPFERATWPFFASNSFSGSDLGFAMIDVFASLNGGRLQVENAQGLGTTVTLFLPASTTEPTA